MLKTRKFAVFYKPHFLKKWTPRESSRRVDRTVLHEIAARIFFVKKVFFKNRFQKGISGCQGVPGGRIWILGNPDFRGPEIRILGSGFPEIQVCNLGGTFCNLGVGDPL